MKIIIVRRLVVHFTFCKPVGPKQIRVKLMSTIYKLINPRRACAGGLRYLSCVSVCTCVPVPTLASTSFVSTCQVRYVRLSFRLFLISTGVFSIEPSVQKLWRERANMQMSIVPLFAHFEHHACISRYLKNKH